MATQEDKSKSSGPDASSSAAQIEGEIVDDVQSEDEDSVGEDATLSSSTGKKKRSKRAALRKALTGKDASSIDQTESPPGQISKDQWMELLKHNPALQKELAGRDLSKMDMSKLDMDRLMTGLSLNLKNQKDMASYKFWQTQPVPRFDEEKAKVDGPIKTIDVEKVPKEPSQMLEGFEWVTMDLTDEVQLAEVYELLTGHYVEDGEALFRFNYSASFLSWALKSPGWRKEWHVGVRVTKTKKLVAFISGVPAMLRVRKNVFASSEINFLCVHKKLRSKRLAPVLIQEITRRCYAEGIFQAIYTGGVILPTPVSSCRYYHRSLDWLKLHEVKFCQLPSGSTKARQVTKNHLPSATSLRGLRPMELYDVEAVQKLLQRYLSRFDMAPELSKEEVQHWLLHSDKVPEQVIWSYVVEDPESKEITDFFSFYCLESSVIGNTKHKCVKAAYLFYYATKTAFNENESGLKERLNVLINDALIIAKKANFDVFNALTLLDNPLFLNEQKFGKGDGDLHYYLYNYRAAPIAGGVNAQNDLDASKRGGVGVVML